MTSLPATPSVSVGLPVFNGERYLAAAIEAHLAQTFRDFELVVRDNASTDGTEAIARAAAARDPRVRYLRLTENVGALANFNGLVAEARGRFFKWAAADDLVAPELLARALAVLERDPGVVMCHSHTRIIDADGTAIGDYTYPPGHAEQPQPSARFADVLREDRWCFALFGVMRTDVLRSTALLQELVGADRVVLAELALRGRFAIVPEHLFSNRDHPGRAVRRFPSHHRRVAHEVPALAGRRLLPHWRILAAYARAARRVPLPREERARCVMALLGWIGRHGNWARLATDPLVALHPTIGDLLARLASSEERWLATRVRRTP